MSSTRVVQLNGIGFLSLDLSPLLAAYHPIEINAQATHLKHSHGRLAELRFGRREIGTKSEIIYPFPSGVNPLETFRTSVRGQGKTHRVKIGAHLPYSSILSGRPRAESGNVKLILTVRASFASSTRAFPFSILNGVGSSTVFAWSQRSWGTVPPRAFLFFQQPTRDETLKVATRSSATENTAMSVVVAICQSRKENLSHLAAGYFIPPDARV